MEPRFLVDAMLGKLARWLVLLGYDARFGGVDGCSDLELLRQAQSEGRTFVTKDRRIPAVAGLPVVVLAGKTLEEQLSELGRELGLKPDPALLFSRCADCNARLAELSREEALTLVPPKVRTLETKFWRCPKCGKLFWEGTHTDRIVAKLKNMGLRG
jgi:hypothetical protein